MQDFAKWREEHGATVTAVRQLLDGEAGDNVLAPTVEEARSQLAAHFKVRVFSLLSAAAHL